MKEFLKNENKVKNSQVLLNDVFGALVISFVVYLILTTDTKMIIELCQEIVAKGNGVALQVVMIFFPALLILMLTLRLGTMMMFQSPESNKSKKKSKNRK